MNRSSGIHGIGVLVILLAVFYTPSDSWAASATPIPAPCTVRNFVVSVGTTQGAAGTQYTPLIFHNHQPSTCSLSGIPSAQPVYGAKKIKVGPPAIKNAVTGRGATVNLVGLSGTASVEYAMGTAANYPKEKCLPKLVDGVIITFPNWKGTIAHQYFPMAKNFVCTKLSSTRISGVVLGSMGQ